MSTIVLVLFIISAVVLIISVLLQTGKGGLGEVFGGGGEKALFGSKGAGGFIVKVTIGAAIAFIATSLFLSVMSSKQARVRQPVPIMPTTPVEPVQPGTGSGTSALPIGAR
jgi:preprotein translocase subunit SecG